MKIAEKIKSAKGITFAFTGGHTLECPIAQLPEHIITQLAIHGLSQKIGDSYAGVKGDVNEAIANAESVWECLLGGSFNQKQTGTGGMLAQAISDVMSIPLDVARTKLAEMDDKTKAKVKKHPDVKGRMAELQLERAQAESANAPALDSLFETEEV